MNAPESPFRAWLTALASDGAMVPAARVLERLDVSERDAPVSAPAEADLTAAEIARAHGRTPAAVRSWCRRGLLVGAYRLNGREWRVPRAALRDFLEGQARGPARAERKPHARVRRRGGPVDLSSWRKVS